MTAIGLRDPAYDRLLSLCSQWLRPPAWYDEAAQAPAFDPPLTPAEQAVYDDLVLMARFGVTLTLDEWRAVKPDAALLKAFLGIANPTNAQAVTAVRAVVRVLGVIVRS